MKTVKSELTIYALSHSLWSPEFSGLLGAKYRDALPFKLKFVDRVKDARVIIWDGVLTPKGSLVQDQLIEQLNHGAILMQTGERRTLLEGHAYVKFATSPKWRVIELPGWGILPEEILKGLNECWELLSNV